MAQTMLSFGPSALLGAFGLWRGPEAVVPTPAEDWRRARIDVVVHADGHQPDIAYCLAALLAQDHPVQRIVLIDDGGADGDHSAQIAREFARVNGMELEIIERMWSIGRGPTLKRQARELDGDVLFFLDGNVVLESPDYLRRCVERLYEGVGTASVRGLHRPSRGAERRAWRDSEPFRHWVGSDDYRDPRRSRDPLLRSLAWVADACRESIGTFQQRFLNRGQMALFGGVGSPPFTATAYRRRYLKDLFDRYEPVYGDRLTHAPELFIALGLSHEGYHNAQIVDVVAHAPGAGLPALAGEHYRATTALMQNCCAFDALVRTPLRWPRRLWGRLRGGGREQAGRDARRIVEAYRQPFGERLTQRDGRPVGWSLFFAAFEKLALPVVVVALAAMQAWGWLAAVLLADAVLWLAILASVSRGGERRALLARSLLVTPLRHLLVLVDAVAITLSLRHWPSRELRRRA